MNFYRIYCGNSESSYASRLGICKPSKWLQRSQYDVDQDKRRKWRDRNKVVIKRLAEMIGAWPQDIDDFLYDLTLQKYSNLLNPKQCGWSHCNVPLCYPNVCDRYMGIFDRLGNLRDPTHPKCLLHLLQLIQDYLNGACNDDCLDLPIHADFSGGRPSSQPRFRKAMNNAFHEPKMEDIDEQDIRESLTWDPMRFGTFNAKKKAPMQPPIETLSYSTNNSPRMSVDQTNEKKKIKRTLGRHSVFLNDELALAHNRPYYYTEALVSEALVRPAKKDSYVGPIGNLRTERMRVLIKQLVEKKGRKIEPEELERAIAKIDLTHHIEKKRQREIAIEISRLYSSIVQTKSASSITQYLSRRKSKLPPPQRSAKRNTGKLSIVVVPQKFDRHKTTAGPIDLARKKQAQ